MKATVLSNYMLYIMSDAFNDLTNMKINKLLYFAQGYSLCQFGIPIFDDKIEAWPHGPVVPSVYETYKSFGSAPIKGYCIESISMIDPKSENVLYSVARDYGKYPASELRKMTHEIGSPWYEVYQEGQAHIEIPLDLIRSYFARSGALKNAEKQFSEDDFVGYRDHNGVLVLPKEWDDGEV